MKTIPLNPLGLGYEAIVDDGLYDYFSQWKWNAQVQKHQVYAVRVTSGPGGKQQKIRMHRQFADLRNCSQVDHINGNGLDNRRENLRACTRTQNQQHARKLSGKHQFKGVNCQEKKRFHRDGSPAPCWQARIRVDRKLISLGYFFTEEDAARAYNAAALKYFGEFAQLNVLPPS